MSVLIVVGLLIGGWVGGGWMQQVSSTGLRKGFAAFMSLAAIKMWFQK